MMFTKMIDGKIEKQISQEEKSKESRMNKVEKKSCIMS